MKFIFESESTINRYEPDYSIEFTTDIDDAEIDFEPKVIALDLLSIEEAEKLPKQIRKYDYWWWLQSHGIEPFSVAFVYKDGETNDNGYGISADIGVRPALTLSNLNSSNLKLYKEYTIFDEKWIYIGKNRFLYNDEVIKHCFDDYYSNDYKYSEIKQLLNDWLRILQNKDLTIEES